MGLVKFVQGDYASFVALAAKDENTLYFITDQGLIYKGDKPFGGNVYKVVEAFPESAQAVLNTIYVNKTDGSVKYWNGTEYQTIVKPSVNAITGSGLADQLVSSKAVVDYVTAALKNVDLSSVTARLDTIEGQIAVINGEGEGSIKKALANAKSYTDGQVKTVADRVTTIEGDYLKAADKDELQGNINTVSGKVNTLVGSDVDKSVRTIANEELAAQLIPEGAQESLNTLQEIAKWIQDHPNDAATLNSAIEKLKGDLAAEITRATGIESGLRTDVDAVPGKIATAKKEAIDTAATDATTKADKALADAKAYTDGEIDKISIPDVSSFLTAEDITSGTANGTIAVEGTDVAVKGLGSAAFAATSAFDAAGSAAAAQANAATDATTKANKALSDAKAYTDTALTWTTL